MFKIIEKNKEFPNVTRIKAVNENNLLVETDVHDLFFDLFSSDFLIKIEKKSEENKLDHDYIMRGKVFKKDTNKTYISFNGLLMNYDNSLNDDIKEGDEVYAYFDN